MKETKTKHRRWTRSEVETVIRLRVAGWSISAIAGSVGRNVSSVGALLRRPKIEEQILKLLGL